MQLLSKAKPILKMKEIKWQFGELSHSSEWNILCALPNKNRLNINIIYRNVLCETRSTAILSPTLFGKMMHLVCSARLKFYMVDGWFIWLMVLTFITWYHWHCARPLCNYFNHAPRTVQTRITDQNQGILMYSMPRDF